MKIKRILKIDFLTDFQHYLKPVIKLTLQFKHSLKILTRGQVQYTKYCLISLHLFLALEMYVRDFTFIFIKRVALNVRKLNVIPDFEIFNVNVVLLIS